MPNSGNHHQPPRRSKPWVTSFILTITAFSLAIFGAISISLASTDTTTSPITSDVYNQTESTDSTPSSTPTNQTTTSEALKAGNTSSLGPIELTLYSVQESSQIGSLVPFEDYVFLLCDFQVHNTSMGTWTLDSVLDFLPTCDDQEISSLFNDFINTEDMTLQTQLEASSTKTLRIIYMVPSQWRSMQIEVTSPLEPYKTLNFYQSKLLM